MFEKIKQHFQPLLEGEPGERFQQQFHQRREDRKNPIIKKFLFIGGGLIVTAAGIIELPLPGPGTVIIIIGLGLLAQESLRLSKFLDWLEVELWTTLDQSQDWWKRSSAVKKAAAVIVTLFILIIIGAACYWLITNLRIT
jgi:uncharacterized protein (TIGR02611 family)